ncbi:3'(2'),5'-bisphosphate nucleotidase CysQ [Aquirufa ecclesiirivi]|uniref:3'(2'),5'-bisphosphate nucleotidase CysQ n=1 Tax=Aquirufa ecclesiirivi TaxID=2715124 RepID=UPI0023D8C921|nr:3'(2'),5'-bisphosphate nucleotidase CysQ [Aquirufa ecclesiirivi]MDF0692479.1 3'(2'),5'-bisphosphate nucleotidase CysQ [Aquirufa ecclesiirivi]
MNKTANLKISIQAAIEAGIEIIKVYQGDFGIDTKLDESPLTKADLVSNQVINQYLVETGIPIISEENKQDPFETRRNWSVCWLVDPLDGTKEFIKRNGEFTVNIALVEDGRPTLGVIFVPCTRELYYADVQAGMAIKRVVDENYALPEDLFPASLLLNQKSPLGDVVRVVGSRSHMNEETHQFIDELKNSYHQVEVVSKGSSLKFCLVAEGLADVYPRFGPTMEWDTAAGHAICHAVGFQVIDSNTQKELSYNKENLLNHYFIVQ